MKKIHQIWLQGEDALPEAYKKYSKLYQNLNPDWQYKLWNLEDIRSLISSKYPHLLKIWEGYEFWVMRVDLGKYCILDDQGGLLIDMDTEPIKAFGNWLPQDKAAVIEHENTFGHRLLGVKRTTNNNFIYVPKPKHPLTQALLKRACCTSERLLFEFKFYYILGSIGPLFLIETIQDAQAALEPWATQGLEWIPSSQAAEYFKDEAANSWNKSMLDEDHDISSLLFFLILLVLVIAAVVKSW